jgi:Uma2 family endonuclease
MSRAPCTGPGTLYGAPELVVEVVSPSNSAAAIQAKVGEYLAAGARVVWVVYPDTRTVAVHEHPSIARFLRDDEPLPGGDALPGLGLTVAEIFR